MEDSKLIEELLNLPNIDVKESLLFKQTIDELSSRQLEILSNEKEN